MISLKNFTHYSIKEAFNKPDTLVEKAKSLGYTHLGICDYNSLAGCVEFHKECLKNKIIPILGATINCNNQWISIFATNRNGWKNLVKIIGRTEINQDNVIVISQENLEKHSDDILAIVDAEIPDLKIKQIVLNYPNVLMLSDHDILYQQILLCSKNNKTLDQWDSLNIPDLKQNTLEYNSGLDHSFDVMIEEQFSEYSIAEKPKLPSLPNVTDPNEQLKILCRQGWVARNLNSRPEHIKNIYVERIKMELDVFREANIAGYFLILKNVVDFIRSQNQQCGLRGSAGGCLVSYLIGLDNMDPIIPDPTQEYDPNKSLLFERFYNKWRNTEGNIAYPDCDLDIPNSFRENVIEFVENLFGKEKVAHIATFGRFDGRGAIKEVFRILHNNSNMLEMLNLITKEMVDAAKIQDILEDLRQDDPNYSVIQYNIDNIPKVKSFYQDFKREFDIAIDMSSTIFSQGKHAAGIVISDEDVADVIPTLIDTKQNRKIVGLEMADAEFCGVIKYDFLGVAALEKLGKISEMINLNLNTPKMNNIQINYGDFDDS